VPDSSIGISREKIPGREEDDLEERSRVGRGKGADISVAKESRQS